MKRTRGKHALLEHALAVAPAGPNHAFAPTSMKVPALGASLIKMLFATAAPI